MGSHVLLTGGSGFVATHILDELLRQDDCEKELLSYSVVPDIVQNGAFEEVVQTNDFDYIIHTACPYHVNITGPVKDFMDPAVKGTVGILEAARKSSSVRRVVLLSSSATIINPLNHAKVYDETVHGVTSMEVSQDPRFSYRAAKVSQPTNVLGPRLTAQIFAEQAAFDFMAQHKPAFDFIVINPPLIFGPAPRHLTRLADLNTSNHRIRDLAVGVYRDVTKLPVTRPVHLFVDVRDVAAAHAKALQVPEAGGRRFFVVAGHFSNKQLADAIRMTHPELDGRLPREDAADDLPKDVYGFDNSNSREMLGLQYRDLHICVRDTVQSLLRVSKLEGSE